MNTSVPPFKSPMRVWNLDAETFIKHTPDAVDLHKKELWRTFMYEEFTNSGTPASAVGFTQDNYIVYRHVSSDALIAMPANEADEYATDRPNWSDLRSGVAKNIAPAARVISVPFFRCMSSLKNAGFGRLSEIYGSRKLMAVSTSRLLIYSSQDRCGSTYFTRKTNVRTSSIETAVSTPRVWIE